MEDTIDERDHEVGSEQALATALRNVRRASRVRPQMVPIETEEVRQPLQTEAS